MLCSQCCKLGFLPKKSSCKVCKKELILSLHNICSECSERKTMCCVCLKILTRAKIDFPSGPGCQGCEG